MSYQKTRDTICLEDAEVISQTFYPGDQYIIRLHAPGCAKRAVPGSFAHVTCDSTIPMRRPLSIMTANPEEGWLEFLYRPVGHGLAQLAKKNPGEFISVLGPIGRGFSPVSDRRFVVAIGGGVGVPPVHFLAETLKDTPDTQLMLFLGSEVPFPFDLGRSDGALAGIAADVDSRVSVLADWGIESRLASNAGFEGCFNGYVTDLARSWLAAKPPEQLAQIQLVSCGPMPMLAATAKLASDYQLPCQVAVEEFMACGVGGCAGCTILVQTPDGPAMKRVCVDGPVFAAEEVFPQ